VLSGTTVLTEKWPVLGRHEQAATWLTIWTDLGRAPRTIDAYARGLAEYLVRCEREDVDPVTANRAHIALFVRELTSRPPTSPATSPATAPGPPSPASSTTPRNR
jgi:site-specific recombinase XerD